MFLKKSSTTKLGIVVPRNPNQIHVFSQSMCFPFDPKSQQIKKVVDLTQKVNKSRKFTMQKCTSHAFLHLNCFSLLKLTVFINLSDERDAPVQTYLTHEEPTARQWLGPYDDPRGKGHPFLCRKHLCGLLGPHTSRVTSLMRKRLPPPRTTKGS